MTYGELQAPGLCHFKGRNSPIFYHNIIKIQDHGVISLVHTTATSLRTPKWIMYEKITPRLLQNPKNLEEHPLGLFSKFVEAFLKL
jgi:hypothetical protein